MISKKGVSPLIATVLLMAFAVSLGAVVMNIIPNIASDECAPIDLTVFTVNGVDRICANDQKVSMTLANDGDTIDGYKITVTGSTSIQTKEEQKLLNQLDKELVEIPLPQGMTVDVVSITPMIVVDNEVKYCAKKQVNYENIPQC